MKIEISKEILLNGFLSILNLIHTYHFENGELCLYVIQT